MLRHSSRLQHCATALLATALGVSCKDDVVDPTPGEPDPRPRPMVIGNSIAPTLIGDWRVLGEGAYLSITANEALQYQMGQTLCYGEVEPLTPEALTGLSYLGTSVAGRGAFDVLEDGNPEPVMTLQRVSALPASCRRVAPTQAAATVQAMCEFIARDYPFFAERQIAWQDRCAKATAEAANAANDDALQAVLVTALQGFNDDHIQLSRPVDGVLKQVFNATGATTVQMLRDAFAEQTEIADFRTFQRAWAGELRSMTAARLTDPHDALEGSWLWGRLVGNVGYINVNRMLAYSEANTAAEDIRLAGEQIDAALASLADTRALIVDVALNGGGRDQVSAEIASRFVDRETLVMVSTQLHPDGLPPRVWTLTPRGGVRYRKPIYLLTSDRSVSAAETFTLMMRELPMVVQTGQPTVGSLSDIFIKPLPGNFTIAYPYQIDRDAHGALYEVRGIPPCLPLTLFDKADPQTLWTGHAAAIDALLARIAADSTPPECTNTH